MRDREKEKRVMTLADACVCEGGEKE